MLEIKNLSAEIDWNQIIDNVNIDFEKWKNYALLWKNGSGKSTLSFCIMWHPFYKITNGDILLNGESIKDMAPENRAKRWIFLAFQNIPEIPWVKLFEFLKLMYNSKFEKEEDQLSFIKFKKLALPIAEEVGVDKDLLFRDINVGFSGWEKRKVEMLQLKLLNPSYIILDEIDSWLDINSLRQLWEILKDLDNKDNSFIIVSHYFDILDYINVDKAVIMKNWLVSKSGWKELLDNIKKDWF